MNKEQAFSILEQALNVANQKGAFLLSDAAVIQQALAVTRNELEIPLPEMVQPVEHEVPESIDSSDKGVTGLVDAKGRD